LEQLVTLTSVLCYRAACYILSWMSWAGQQPFAGRLSQGPDIGLLVFAEITHVTCRFTAGLIEWECCCYCQDSRGAHAVFLFMRLWVQVRSLFHIIILCLSVDDRNFL